MDDKIINLNEVESLQIKNILYKIQLENEKLQKYKILIENSNLCKSLAEKDLKIWENTLKNKLSKKFGDIKTMEIDADLGKVILNSICDKKLEV